MILRCSVYIKGKEADLLVVDDFRHLKEKLRALPSGRKSIYYCYGNLELTSFKMGLAQLVMQCLEDRTEGYVHESSGFMARLWLSIRKPPGHQTQGNLGICL